VAVAKRSLVLQLDEVVQAMLVSLQPRPEEAPDRDLASLTRVAQGLRDLPRQEFRAALKSDLQRRATMSEAIAGTGAARVEQAHGGGVHYQRPGLTAITPYIIVRPAARFLDFLKTSFDGIERLRMPAPDGSIMHAEIAIGNGAIEVSDGNEQYPTAPAAIHLYVDDPDATYARTLQAGATSFYAPTDDHPSGDRWGAVKDPFGNHWYIAKPRGWTPGPEGLRSVQPYLHLRGADKMIPFMETAFGAECIGLHKSPEGIVHHATIRIGNATLEIDEAHGEFQPMPCHLHVYVPDADAAYARALHAGATSIDEPRNAPYGDRAAGVKDAWGNSWFIATYLGQ
jgi:PhnB protein